MGPADEIVEAAFGDAERVRELLRAGADPNAAGTDRSTPLYIAAIQGEASIVRLLLDAGADPNLESRGENEGTPLCAAAASDELEAVRELLARGADPNLAASDDLLPLGWAASHGSIEIATVLLDAGANPNLGDVLFNAVKRGSLAIVRLLLERGAHASEEALALAVDVAGKDVEEDLRSHALGSSEGVITRKPLADGTELLRLEVGEPVIAACERETGHVQIAELLRAALSD
jgi:hypothetical protein